MAEKAAQAWYDEEGAKRVTQDNAQMNVRMIKLGRAVEVGLKSSPAAAALLPPGSHLPRQTLMPGRLCFQASPHACPALMPHPHAWCLHLQATCPATPYAMPGHPHLHATCPAIPYATPTCLFCRPHTQSSLTPQDRRMMTPHSIRWTQSMRGA